MMEYLSRRHDMILWASFFLFFLVSWFNTCPFFCFLPIYFLIFCILGLCLENFLMYLNGLLLEVWHVEYCFFILDACQKAIDLVCRWLCIWVKWIFIQSIHMGLKNELVFPFQSHSTRKLNINWRILSPTVEPIVQEIRDGTNMEMWYKGLVDWGDVMLGL